MATVCIYVYDLSMGMARVMSVSLVGKQVDIVPHTGVVVEWPSGAKEYFFGGGVCVTPAGQAMGMPTCEIIPLGRTTKSMAEVDAFLRELSPRFTADTYNLLSHNCNHFSNELAHFLTGGTGGVPARIVNVADEALSAPQGQQLRMMLESMQANMAAAQLGNRFNPLAHVPPVAAAPTTAPTTAAAAAAAAAGAPIAPTTAPQTATPVAVATAPAGPPAATVDEPPLNLTPLREALVALDAVRDATRGVPSNGPLMALSLASDWPLIAL
jgi:hypothetical protein